MDAILCIGGRIDFETHSVCVSSVSLIVEIISLSHVGGTHRLNKHPQLVAVGQIITLLWNIRMLLFSEHRRKHA